jgi:hypothetical protein
MNCTSSQRKKSRSSKERPDGAAPVLPPEPRTTDPAQERRAALRREFREWRASLPAGLERDTFLMPDVIAESVVREAELFLQADLPAEFAARLAARAHYLYTRNRHFHEVLNRSGNGPRNDLYMFMRHWTAGWLKRAHSPLFKKLPRSFANGLPLSSPN